MFENVYPHKIPFKEVKDEKIFEDFKMILRKYHIEAINVYYSKSKTKSENNNLYIMTRNALGILPDNNIVIACWNEILEANGKADLITSNVYPIFINAEAMALEKVVREEKNKVYASKIVNKYAKLIPYKVFAFNTYTNGTKFCEERNELYLYCSGYNIIFNTKDEYEKALQKKDIIESNIKAWLNKLTNETLHKKTNIEPVIRFLYKDLIQDIDEMDKENKKEF